jgi:hypothetical protein
MVVVVHGYFRQNGGCVAIDHRQRLVHLTPHMFNCHRSQSWISRGDHFLVKNPYVLAFGIIENGRFLAIFDKIEVLWPLIIDQRLIHLAHICFLAVDHILGFLVETISWAKIRMC